MFQWGIIGEKCKKRKIKMESLFKQYEGVFEEKEEAAQKKKAGFEFAYSPFALQDAIGEKNIKKIWIEYQKLRFLGIEAEDLIHKITGKVRDMLSIILGADKEDLGAKDYTFNKSKRDSKNWEKNELENFYTRLVEIYHFSRIKGDNLDISLEKILLSL